VPQSDYGSDVTVYLTQNYQHRIIGVFVFGCVTVFDCYFMQDHLSSSSDIDIISSDHNDVVLDEDERDIDVVAASTPDDTSKDVNRTIGSKRRKQLLTERATHSEFSEVSLCIPRTSSMMIGDYHLFM